MRPRLAALAATQLGIVTRTQAREAGYTVSEIRALTREGGPWVVVRRGAYAERDLWESLPEHPDRWAMRDRAAHLTMVQEHAMSHDSAARALLLDMLRPPDPLVHICRRGVGGSRTEHGVKHHLCRTRPADLTTVDGIVVTGPARTVVDVTREHGFTHGCVLADAVLRTMPDCDLAAGLVGMEHVPGVVAARSAVAHADPGAESVGETLARLLVLELGIGEPVTQFPVLLPDGSIAWCDLRVGRQLFEFDGKLKYLRRAEGGVADEPAGEVVWREKKRERLVCGQGLGMSRLVWEDVWGPGRAAARIRLKAEYEVTRARYGEVLPAHLEEFARRMAGRRRADPA